MEAVLAAPLKVLIADDHPLMIAGVRRALAGSDSIEVVGEARSAPEVLELIKRRRPQVVLLDLRMPGCSGTSCIMKIREVSPDVKVVVLSANDDRASIDGALTAGASAYIVKSVHSADIAAVLRQTASGDVFHFVARGHAPAEQLPDPHVPVLTGRERAILERVAAGLTTAAISKELWVSEHTVKFHLTNIYRKLDVPNRACAVRCALETGLVAT